MDDSQEILLNSLRNSGVQIPPSVAAIRDLTPASLFSICSQSLSLIDRTLSFPASLPEDSMADRFKLCSELASAFRRLGLVGDVSFHKFLYPSEEDLYKLVRFLVGRLAISESESSESSQVQKSLNENQTKEIRPEIKFLRLQTEAAESANANSQSASLGEFNEDERMLGNSESDENDGVGETRADVRGSNSEGWRKSRVRPASMDKVEGMERTLAGKDKTVPLGVDEHVHKHEQDSASLQELSCEQKMLMDLIAKTSKSTHGLDECELFKAAVAFENQNSLDIYIQQLKDSIEARREHLVKLDSHEWNALTLPLEEKRGNLEEALCVMKPEAREKLQKKKEIVKDIGSVFAEIRRREEELSVLSAELENQPKVAPRESFVVRIKEITKNSRKQDADVERIQRETRELQLEINSIQDRLNRTYAVVDETIFREARKDPVARQAYRLLTKIHECFEQTAEKVLSTDRTRRQVADYEAKLATMASQSLNIDKLRADLDAIRKENDILQGELENS